MTKDLFIKLYDKLGRDPTDDEMADAMADLIDDRAPEEHLALLTFLVNQR